MAQSWKVNNNNIQSNFKLSKLSNSFEHIRLGNRFRLTNAIYQIEENNLHYGFEISTKKEVIIISCQAPSDQRKTVHTKIQNNLNKPLWIGNQTFRGSKLNFKVYYKKGCSIHEYFNELSLVKPIHLHFALKTFSQLIQRMHFHKIDPKFIDLRTIFLRCAPQSTKTLIFDFFCFENLETKEPPFKDNSTNISGNFQSSSKYSQSLQKKVTYSEESGNVQASKFATIESLVLKFYDALSKTVICNPLSCQYEEDYQSFSTLLSFFKKHDKKSKRLSCGANQFIQRLMEIQKSLLKQNTAIDKIEVLHEIEIEAIKINERIMENNRCYIQKIDKILEYEQNEILYRTENQSRQASMEDSFSYDQTQQKQGSETALSQIMISHTQISSNSSKNDFITHHKSRVFEKLKPVVEQVRQKSSSLPVLFTLENDMKISLVLDSLNN